MKYISIIVLLCIQCSFVHAQSVIRSEILGRPTDHSIMVSIFFDQDAYARVKYGTSAFIRDQATAWQIAKKGEPVEILVDGLQASKEYSYVVEYVKDTVSGEILSQPTRLFKTAKKSGEPFTFVVQADPHLDVQSDTALYALCLQNQLTDMPDLMFDLGDILMTDKLGNAQKVVTKDTILYRCNLLRSYYERINHSVPLFIALGNHEGEASWNLKNNGENFAVWSTNERKRFFMNPYPNDFYTGDTIVHQYVGQRHNYYSFTWGDAQFFVLDPYWYTMTKPDSLNGWRWTLGKVQYDWLKKSLEQSTSPFKFIMAHQLVGGDPLGRGGIEFASLYEWGGNNLDGTRGFEKNRPGWYKPIKDILRENKATIFFHGHDHFFAKQEMDCLIYQECPQPSHPNFSGVNSAKDYGYLNGEILPNSGHMRIRVQPTQIQVEYVRAYLPKNETANRKNKDVAATYTIPANKCYDSLSTGIAMFWNDEYLRNEPYPNPSNGSMIFPLDIKQAGSYDVHIFDMKGQMRKEISMGIMLEAGIYHVQWDGIGDNGAALESGSYMYVLGHKGAIVKSGNFIVRD
ncbi:MAG: metallophosphoesterase [Bacteroidota bacterium]